MNNSLSIKLCFSQKMRLIAFHVAKIRDVFLALGTSPFTVPTMVQTEKSTHACAHSYTLTLTAEVKALEGHLNRGKGWKTDPKGLTNTELKRANGLGLFLVLRHFL